MLIFAGQEGKLPSAAGVLAATSFAEVFCIIFFQFIMSYTILIICGQPPIR